MKIGSGPAAVSLTTTAFHHVPLDKTGKAETWQTSRKTCFQPFLEKDRLQRAFAEEPPQMGQNGLSARFFRVAFLFIAHKLERNKMLNLLKPFKGVISVVYDRLLDLVIELLGQVVLAILRDICLSFLRWWHGLDLLAVAPTFSDGLQFVSLF